MHRNTLVFAFSSFLFATGCDSLVIDCDMQCDTRVRVNNELSCEVVRDRSSCISACEQAGREASGDCVKDLNTLIDCQDAAPITAWSCSTSTDEGPTFSATTCTDEIGAVFDCAANADMRHDGCVDRGDACTCSNTGLSGTCGTGPDKGGIYCRCG